MIEVYVGDKKGDAVEKGAHTFYMTNAITPLASPTKSWVTNSTLHHCPYSPPLPQPAIQSLTRAPRRVDICSWSSHPELQQTAFLLGSTPPKLLRKYDQA